MAWASPVRYGAKSVAHWFGAHLLAEMTHSKTIRKVSGSSSGPIFVRCTDNTGVQK